MTNVLIWGSCVSRDTFDYLPDDYELIAYAARQSWLSAGNDATLPAAEPMASEFQERMSQGDAAGDAIERLCSHQDADVFLLDLTDERLGVVIGPSGAVLTRSVDRMNAEQQGQIDAAGEVLEFGSEEHFTLWCEAAERVRDELSEKGMFAKTLVLAPAWAFYDDEAEPMPSSFGNVALEMNQVFERYHQRLVELGFAIHRLDATVGSSTHKWGLAPFHYHDSVYEELVAAIQRFVATTGESASKS